MAEPREVIVVPTTHWDRDWYWPFERFRVKLIQLFAAAKTAWAADPAWTFAIDGQAVPVEDYLEAVPGDAELLARLGREGRFTMGPVYVQSDTWCTGGEAFVRNLLVGRAMSERFHALQGPLYLPDSFGHVPELPMLAAGFGIRTVALMRGAPEAFAKERFLRWTHADGSEVRVLRLRDGYGNAANLGLARGEDTPERKASGLAPVYDQARAITQLRETAKRQLDDSQGDPVLLLAGSDHVIPRADLGAVLAATSDGAVRYRFGHLDDADRALWARDGAAFPHHHGEMHGLGAGSILGGTVSTRVYLKLANAIAERTLVDIAEPADALALLHGIDEPSAAVIGVAWKRLLKAHPHDDITGCSVDPVHRENEQHIACATQAADAARRRLGTRLVAAFGGQKPGDERQAFLAIDTSGHGGARRFETVLDLEGRHEWADYRLPEHYAVVDEAGAEVPFRELSREPSTENPHIRLHLELHAPLRPFAPARFFIEPRRAWAESAMGGTTLANERLRVHVRPDGAVDLLDRRTGKHWTGIGTWTQQADLGEEYDFAAMPGDREAVLTPVRVERLPTVGCAGLQTVRLRLWLAVPRDAAARADGGGTVEVPVVVDYSLAPGDAWLTCHATIENRAADWRLRWNAALPELPQRTVAGAWFGTVERPAAAQRTPDGRTIAPEHPAGLFAAAPVGDGGGLALFPSCPLNYEIVDGDAPRLAVTLVRAVGRLGAGMTTRTPEAQCLGRRLEHVLAIRPYAADEAGGLLAEAVRWRKPAFTVLVWGIDPRWTDDTAPTIALAPGPVSVAACKRAHDGQRVVLRLHNASATVHEARLTLRGVRSLVPLGLDERPRGEVRGVGADGTVAVTVPAYGLATVELVRA